MRVRVFVLLLLYGACNENVARKSQTEDLLSPKDADSIGKIDKSVIPKDDDAEIEAGEPGVIAGSYLVCADDPLLIQTPGTETFGCRLENGRGEKVNGFIPTDGDVVATSETNTISGAAVPLDSFFWHWIFHYVSLERDSYHVTMVRSPIKVINEEAKILAIHPRREAAVESEEQGPGPGEDSAPSPDTEPTKRGPGPGGPIGPGPKKPTLDAKANHIVFTTSLSYRPGGKDAPQFDSLEGADLICQAHATTAALPGTYLAVLSNDFKAARDRIPLNKPIVNPLGRLVANFNFFWSNSLVIPLNVDEYGDTITTPPLKAWTGSNRDGAPLSLENCTAWRELVLGKGHYGAIDKTDTWIDDSFATCDQSLRFYCMSL